MGIFRRVVVEQKHDVRILFNASAIAQIVEHRFPLIIGGRPVQLRQCNYRNAMFPRHEFERPRNVADLFNSPFMPSAAGKQLQVINNHEIKPALCLALPNGVRNC